jgi:hypothetical protein
MQPLDVVLAGVELDIVGRVHAGAFYECRDGSIVGPMIDDGHEPSFGYVTALGGTHDDLWLTEGWSRTGERGRDLVKEAQPPLMWTGRSWSRPGQ